MGREEEKFSIVLFQDESRSIFPPGGGLLRSMTDSFVRPPGDEVSEPFRCLSGLHLITDPGSSVRHGMEARPG